MPPRPLGPTGRKWAEKARELEFTELDRVRSISEKWAGSIAALTGVFGLTALVKSPADVSRLTAEHRMVVGIALVAAVLFAVVAAILAALAAQGVPRKLRLTGPDLAEHYSNAAGKAVFKLTVSRVLLVVALVGLGTAICFTWYGKSAATEPGHFLAIQQSGTALCGELAADEQGRLMLRASDRSVAMLNQIVSLDPVDQCPVIPDAGDAGTD